MTLAQGWMNYLFIVLTRDERIGDKNILSSAEKTWWFLISNDAKHMDSTV